MTNKITVPRELIHRAIDAVEQVGYQDKFIDYTFVGAVKNELRAALAEPVSPAGGEVEVLQAFSDHAKQFTFKNHPATPGMFPVGFPWFKAGYEIGHARLQAEVERLKDNVRWKPVADQQMQVITGLQAELTKARELLTDVAKTPWMYDVLGSVREHLSNQSAPADKAPPLIQALHVNGDRIAMEATIAQQAQRIADLEADKGQGEPAAVGAPKLEMAQVVRAHMEISGCPVLTSNQCHTLAMKLNACLDEVTRLNGVKP